MDQLLKAAAGSMIAVVIALVVGRQSKESALLLITAACCMIAVTAVQYLQPAVDFLGQLQSLGGLDPQVLQILLKTTGIAILSEITGLICADAGYGALGKTLQLLAAAVILWLSLPLLNKLLELIQNVLVST